MDGGEGGEWLDEGREKEKRRSMKRRGGVRGGSASFRASTASTNRCLPPHLSKDALVPFRCLCLSIRSTHSTQDTCNTLTHTKHPMPFSLCSALVSLSLFFSSLPSLYLCLCLV